MTFHDRNNLSNNLDCPRNIISTTKHQNNKTTKQQNNKKRKKKLRRKRKKKNNRRKHNVTATQTKPKFNDSNYCVCVGGT
jgi:hypothetical protein